MALFSIPVPKEVKYFFAVFNLVACAGFVILRVFDQRKQKIEQKKLSWTGLSCMLLALIYCSSVVNHESTWYFGDIRWCELSMKLSTSTYTLHRVILYIFLILRVEVVNKSKFMNPRIIYAGKPLIGVTGIFMLAASIVFTEGVQDEHSSCSFNVTHNGIFVLVGVIDTSICVAGTMMFIRPIRQTLVNMENSRLRNMLRKTTYWSIVCLVSTLLATLTIGVIDGAAGVMGFDCSITSLSLVMMMSSKSHKTCSESFFDTKQVLAVELDEKTIDSPEKLSPCLQRGQTDILIDKLMKGFQSEDSNWSNNS